MFLVYVRFGPGVGGIGSVLVEKKDVRLGKASKFMSGEDWAQIYLEDVRVPAENVLLGEGGFKKQIGGFNVERIGNASRSLALGRYAYEAARSWALERRQFGRLLCEFQGLQWKFAEMKMKLDAAQLLLYRAAANADRGLPSPEETAIAKAYCNQAGFEVANESLQVMGGRVLPAPLPRLDDCRWLDRNTEEPHRRAHLRAQLFPARGKIITYLVRN